MNLELNILNIMDVRFGKKTMVRDGVLIVNREELCSLIAMDPNFTKVNIELAHAGENLRIINIHNVIEPRAKMDCTGENFPGVLGQLKIAGQGRTRVLRSIGIVTIDRMSGMRGTVIDMTGPGAKASPFGILNHIILDCYPIVGIQWVELQYALTVAAAKVSVYLAEASLDLEADEKENYNLGSPDEVGKGIEHLPRVAYIYFIHYMQMSVSSKAPVYYGDPVAKLLPTIIHPNEILDGAVVQGLWNWCQSTYFIQNHPVITELYRKHGKELCFAGVVGVVATTVSQDNKRNAMLASNLAKHVLNADGVILSKIGGGAPNVDLGLTVEACEDLGIKTTVICHDMSPDGSSDAALLFSTPEAQAIVCVGAHDVPFILPPVSKVIGGEAVNDMPATGEIRIVGYRLADALSIVGGSRIKSQEI
ncbi:glycine/sarcosine/betaine reductase component B subunit [Chloroflexota bacterium]